MDTFLMIDGSIISPSDPKQQEFDLRGVGFYSQPGVDTVWPPSASLPKPLPNGYGRKDVGLNHGYRVDMIGR